MKYLVMECRLSYAVVMDENGRFLKAANQNYEVGQTVTDIVEMQVPQAKPKRPWHRQLSALAACLILVLTSLFLLDRIPYASVYISINPQVRIDVNRRDKVIQVTGVNSDGKDLLAGYDHRSKRLDQVMDDLVDRAIDMGYLHEGGKVTLTLDAEETWVVDHEAQLNQHLNKHLTENITIVIDVDPSPTVSPTDPTRAPVLPSEPPRYDDSDYGEPTQPVCEDGATDYDPEAHHSDYDDTDSHSDYEEPTKKHHHEEPDSDYGDSPYQKREPDSGYGDSGCGDSSH